MEIVKRYIFLKDSTVMNFPSVTTGGVSSNWESSLRGDSYASDNDFISASKIQGKSLTDVDSLSGISLRSSSKSILPPQEDPDVSSDNSSFHRATSNPDFPLISRIVVDTQASNENEFTKTTGKMGTKDGSTYSIAINDSFELQSLVSLHGCLSDSDSTSISLFAASDSNSIQSIKAPIEEVLEQMRQVFKIGLSASPEGLHDKNLLMYWYDRLVHGSSHQVALESRILEVRGVLDALVQMCKHPQAPPFDALDERKAPRNAHSFPECRTRSIKSIMSISPGNASPLSVARSSPASAFPVCCLCDSVAPNHSSDTSEENPVQSGVRPSPLLCEREKAIQRKDGPNSGPFLHVGSSSPTFDTATGIAIMSKVGTNQSTQVHTPGSSVASREASLDFSDANDTESRYTEGYSDPDLKRTSKQTNRASRDPTSPSPNMVEEQGQSHDIRFEEVKEEVRRLESVVKDQQNIINGFQTALESYKSDSLELLHQKDIEIKKMSIMLDEYAHLLRLVANFSEPSPLTDLLDSRTNPRLTSIPYPSKDSSGLRKLSTDIDSRLYNAYLSSHAVTTEASPEVAKPTSPSSLSMGSSGPNLPPLATSSQLMEASNSPILSPLVPVNLLAVNTSISHSESGPIAQSDSCPVPISASDAKDPVEVLLGNSTSESTTATRSSEALTLATLAAPNLPAALDTAPHATHLKRELLRALITGSTLSNSDFSADAQLTVASTAKPTTSSSSPLIVKTTTKSGALYSANAVPNAPLQVVAHTPPPQPPAPYPLSTDTKPFPTAFLVSRPLPGVSVPHFDLKEACSPVNSASPGFNIETTSAVAMHTSNPVHSPHIQLHPIYPLSPTTTTTLNTPREAILSTSSTPTTTSTPTMAAGPLSFASLSVQDFATASPSPRASPRSFPRTLSHSHSHSSSPLSDTSTPPPPPASGSTRNYAPYRKSPLGPNALAPPTQGMVSYPPPLSSNAFPRPEAGTYFGAGLSAAQSHFTSLMASLSHPNSHPNSPVQPLPPSGNRNETLWSRPIMVHTSPASHPSPSYSTPPQATSAHGTPRSGAAPLSPSPIPVTLNSPPLQPPAPPSLSSTYTPDADYTIAPAMMTHSMESYIHSSIQAMIQKGHLHPTGYATERPIVSQLSGQTTNSPMELHPLPNMISGTPRQSAVLPLSARSSNESTSAVFNHSQFLSDFARMLHPSTPPSVRVQPPPQLPLSSPSLPTSHFGYKNTTDTYFPARKDSENNTPNLTASPPRLYSRRNSAPTGALLRERSLHEGTYVPHAPLSQRSDRTHSGHHGPVHSLSISIPPRAHLVKAHTQSQGFTSPMEAASKRKEETVPVVDVTENTAKDRANPAASLSIDTTTNNMLPAKVSADTSLPHSSHRSHSELAVRESADGFGGSEKRLQWSQKGARHAMATYSMPSSPLASSHPVAPPFGERPKASSLVPISTAPYPLPYTPSAAFKEDMCFTPERNRSGLGVWASPDNMGSFISYSTSASAAATATASAESSSRTVYDTPPYADPSFASMGQRDGSGIACGPPLSPLSQWKLSLRDSAMSTPPLSYRSTGYAGDYTALHPFSLEHDKRYMRPYYCTDPYTMQPIPVNFDSVTPSSNAYHKAETSIPPQQKHHKAPANPPTATVNDPSNPSNGLIAINEPSSNDTIFLTSVLLNSTAQANAHPLIPAKPPPLYLHATATSSSETPVTKSKGFPVFEVETNLPHGFPSDKESMSYFPMGDFHSLPHHPQSHSADRGFHSSDPIWSSFRRRGRMRRRASAIGGSRRASLSAGSTNSHATSQNASLYSLPSAMTEYCDPVKHPQVASITLLALEQEIVQDVLEDVSNDTSETPLHYVPFQSCANPAVSGGKCCGMNNLNGKSLFGTLSFQFLELIRSDRRKNKDLGIPQLDTAEFVARYKPKNLTRDTDLRRSKMCQECFEFCETIIISSLSCEEL